MESINETYQYSNYRFSFLRICKESCSDVSSSDVRLSRQKSDDNGAAVTASTFDCKGPNDDLERAIYAQLIRSPYREVRHTRVMISGGSVILLGTVSTYFAKQMAQETIRGFTGHRRIDNQLSVTESVARSSKPR